MGRNRKQIAGNVPINLRFQKRAGDRKAILIDHFYDGKHHYENTGLFLIGETNEKARRENGKSTTCANHRNYLSWNMAKRKEILICRSLH